MIDLHFGDCNSILPSLSNVDVIITDPPYPDYYKEEYKYYDGIISSLELFKCRQLIFWTAKVDFPLSYSAIHIWDKKTGCGSEYERIFERNGNKNFKVFRHYLINSTVAASYTGDIFTGHPSQKPIKLILDLIEKFTKPGQIILDPFMGSGTVGEACVKTGRNFIGIEQSKTWYEYAKDRINNTVMQYNIAWEA